MDNGTRRTTLTFPAKVLTAAERVARRRKVTLSVVVAEALEEKLQKEEEAKRSAEQRIKTWEASRQAHAGLTDEEWMLLDGIILEPVDDKS